MKSRRRIASSWLRVSSRLSLTKEVITAGIRERRNGCRAAKILNNFERRTTDLERNCPHRVGYNRPPVKAETKRFTAGVQGVNGRVAKSVTPISIARAGQNGQSSYCAHFLKSPLPAMAELLRKHRCSPLDRACPDKLLNLKRYLLGWVTRIPARWCRSAACFLRNTLPKSSGWGCGSGSSSLPVGTRWLR